MTANPHVSSSPPRRRIRRAAQLAVLVGGVGAMARAGAQAQPQSVSSVPAGALNASKPADPSTPDPIQGYLSVPSGRLYFEECGSGLSLILLHDGLLTSSVWDDVWPLLCARYHVVRYDRRGYGRSDAATSAFSPTDDLLKIADKAGMSRPILVGSSSGSAVALDFAIAHSDRVEALVLVGPVVHGMRSSDWFNRRGANMTAESWSRDPYQIHGPNPVARKKILDVLTASPQNLTAAGKFESRPVPPSVTRLSEIRAPTLLIIGDGDVGDVHAFAGAIQAALPVVRREVWKDAGHLVQLEQPKNLVDRLAAFVTVAERRTVAVPAADLARFAGDYSVGGSKVTIALKVDQLVFQQNGDADVPLFAASPSTFFVRTTGTDVTFEAGADGRIAAMIIVNPGAQPVRCPRA